MDNNDLLHQLQSLECPFTWKIPLESSEKTFRRAEMRASEDKLQKGKIQETAVAMTLLYEYARRGEIERASTALKEWEQVDPLVSPETEFESPVIEFENSKEFATSEALKHVKLACKCFLLVKLEKFSELKNTIAMITPFQSMSNFDQATAYWLKSDMLKDYGYSAVKEALQWIEEALKLHSQNPILHYQFGRLLGRLRRMERTDMPDFREISFLETAVRETGDKNIMIMLAQTYSDKAQRLNYSGGKRSNMEQIHELNEKASHLYRSVLNNHKRTYSLNVRCAEGLLKLPPRWRDLEKVKECLDEAFVLDPCGILVNHIAGKYYRITGDIEKAKHHLLLSSHNMTRNYGACMDLMIMKKKESSAYNPIPVLEKLLLANIFEQAFTEDILCRLGACYYFEMKDFKKALEFWSQVIEKNIDCKKLKVFTSALIRARQPVNINQIIVKEIQKLKKKGECSSDENQILEKLIISFPELSGER